MRKRVLSYIVVACGILLVAAGLLGLKQAAEAQGLLQALPYLGIGLGCGLFGHGAGEMISRVMEKQNPDAVRAMRIEQKDERNVAVGNRAKAKAWDAMIFLFGALNLALVLMGVELLVVLLCVFAYLFVLGIALYYRIRFDREM